MLSTGKLLYHNRVGPDKLIFSYASNERTFMECRFSGIAAAKMSGNGHMGMEVIKICMVVHFVASGLLLLGVTITMVDEVGSVGRDEAIVGGMTRCCRCNRGEC
ncbi:unnamed protein product [Lactuca saligna]|uniref:Uncharacterized protein n=1 Tax=Lactuca saligna TaxID=75948 RepID=A0AA36ED28_LACSI|nr:unnamed protein product [Lactuca saligna]